MKKALTLLVFMLSFASFWADAQTATPVSPRKKDNNSVPDPGNQVFYCCRYCDYTAKAERNCPVHQIALIRVGSWYCPKDGVTSQNAGVCPHDNTDFVRMNMKYQVATPKPADLNKDTPVKK